MCSLITLDVSSLTSAVGHTLHPKLARTLTPSLVIVLYYDLNYMILHCITRNDSRQYHHHHHRFCNHHHYSHYHCQHHHHHVLCIDHCYTNLIIIIMCLTIIIIIITISIIITPLPSLPSHASSLLLITTTIIVYTIYLT